MREGRKFVQGALVLTAANIVVKILGAVYRIPLLRILGEEGMGLFMAVYPLYAMMLSISTAGVPLAVSKLVSEKIALGNQTGARQVFQVARTLMLASGLIVTALLAIAAPYYTANILKVPRTLLPMLAVAPSIVFYAVKAAYRGYFQGQQRMGPSAFASIAEQLVRVGTIFFLALLLIKHSVDLAAAGAAFGSATGAAAGLGLLMVFSRRSGRENNEVAAQASGNSLLPTKHVVKEIFTLALPITIGSILVPIVSMVDSTLILPRLQAGGFSQKEALAMLGLFSGAAMSLVNVPTIFTVGLGTSLLPAIAEAYAQKRYDLIKKFCDLSVRVGQIIALPAAVGLFVLAEPISVFLFNNAAVARPLSVVAFATVSIVLNQTTAPVLQGLGKTYLPITHMFFGLLVKVAINYFFTPVPTINILAPAAGTILAFALATYLNLRSIKKLIGYSISPVNGLIKPGINSLLMGAGIYLLHPLFEQITRRVLGPGASPSILNGMAVILSIAVGMLIYAAATLASGTLTRADLEPIPAIGPKLAKFLTRFGLLR